MTTRPPPRQFKSEGLGLGQSMKVKSGEIERSRVTSFDARCHGCVMTRRSMLFDRIVSATARYLLRSERLFHVVSRTLHDA